MPFQRKSSPKFSKSNYRTRKPAAQPTSGQPSWYVTKAGKVVPVDLLVTVDTQWGERAKVKFRNADTGFWVNAERVFPSRQAAQKFAESVEAEEPSDAE